MSEGDEMMMEMAKRMKMKEGVNRGSEVQVAQMAEVKKRWK
jgi:hypothetical protein